MLNKYTFFFHLFRDHKNRDDSFREHYKESKTLGWIDLALATPALIILIYSVSQSGVMN